jgi:hypothetical protein
MIWDSNHTCYGQMTPIFLTCSLVIFNASLQKYRGPALNTQLKENRNLYKFDPNFLNLNRSFRVFQFQTEENTHFQKFFLMFNI